MTFHLSCKVVALHLHNTDASPDHYAFYFRGSGLPSSFSGICSDFICKVNIALQELQAVVLCRMTFHLSCKVVALHLHNTDASPDHYAFYFKGSGLPSSFSGICSDFICKVNIALQELQAVVLCRMTFHLSCKVVALHLDNKAFVVI